MKTLEKAEDYGNPDLLSIEEAIAYVVENKLWYQGKFVAKRPDLSSEDAISFGEKFKDLNVWISVFEREDIVPYLEALPLEEAIALEAEIGYLEMTSIVNERVDIYIKSLSPEKAILFAAKIGRRKFWDKIFMGENISGKIKNFLSKFSPVQKINFAHKVGSPHFWQFILSWGDVQELMQK
ncbi:MAG: hypothetical protein ABH951_02660 [Patescibacteria group bacterium]